MSHRLSLQSAEKRKRKRARDQARWDGNVFTLVISFIPHSIQSESHGTFVLYYHHHRMITGTNLYFRVVLLILGLRLYSWNNTYQVYSKYYIHTYVSYDMCDMILCFYCQINDTCTKIVTPVYYIPSNHVFHIYIQTHEFRLLLINNPHSNKC